MLGLTCGAPAQAQQLIFTQNFEPRAGLEDQEASRLLAQASFGATPEDIAEVRNRGIPGWINWQLTRSPRYHLPFVDQIEASGEDVYQNVRIESWFRRGMNAPDQLRQRVAFALSEILVVSDRSGGLEGAPFALAQYYDMLLDHVFGNYRDLLRAVSVSPVMGLYLSSLGNQKADPDSNLRPDENYAREIMQLFTIGLVMLNDDGTIRDGDPGTAGVQPIPTYDQNVISALARVFTGWKWMECAGAHPDRPWEWEFCGPASSDANPTSGWRAPMQVVAWQHDTENKALISYNGMVPGAIPLEIPALGTGESDLDDALDILVNHPNVAPFIARRLIQRLVSSNPSPAYVGRVADVFRNNGSGEYGDLAEVVRAILLDSEARDPSWRSHATRGKLREPLIRHIHLLRALNAFSGNDRFYPWQPENSFAQAPLRSPSVFNFFLPDYQPPGEIQDLGLVAPEFQITTDTYIIAANNAWAAQIYWNFVQSDAGDPDNLQVDLRPEEALASDPPALVDRYNLLFADGQLPIEVQMLLIEHVRNIEAQWNPNWRRNRVQDALVLTITSPYAAVLR
ncbi:MAG: DUF1800 domain-containing protein [Xanthomonadales bacterium]|nr:DUF1800 domain-containing protein [Xanthomonadales bacterium]